MTDTYQELRDEQIGNLFEIAGALRTHIQLRKEGGNGILHYLEKLLKRHESIKDRIKNV